MSGVSKKSKVIKKKKTSRKKKDPNAPKRPRSAYILFSQEKRDEVKAKHPNAKPSEMMQIMGKMWKDLPESEKKPFADRAGEDKSRFSEEMKDYSPPDEDDDEESEDEDDDDDDEDGGKKKKKKKGGKKKKDPNAPKKGMSAYLHYSQSVRERVKANNPNARSAELMQIVGKMWKELSTDQKQPFFDLAKRDRERYEGLKAQYIASGGGAAPAAKPKASKKAAPPAKKAGKSKPQPEPEPEDDDDDDDDEEGDDDDEEEDDDDDDEEDD